METTVLSILALLVGVLACPFPLPEPNASPHRLTLALDKRQSSWTVGQVVSTTSGQVQGTASTLRSDVSAYLGIPFAQPPTGNLRFEAPAPVGRATGIINATKVGPDCPCNLIPIAHAEQQLPAGGTDILIAVSQHGDVLDENCLSVNVWTKPQTGEAKKAVMFWVFGGGFSIGNAVNKVYDGSILADENDVVVVSANYRTNIFGFSGAPGVTQNVGLLDQRLAMEWARDNVAVFGGDPGRITLFGQSAGGASVDFIPFAYPDDPIAHAIIPQSGTANAIFAAGTSSSTLTDNWYNVSSSLGCGGNETGVATVTCMRTKTTTEILSALSPISTVAIMSGFSPIVDNKTVPYDITTRLSNGDFAHLPTLAGNTENEAGFFVALWFAYSNVTAAQLAAQPQWVFSLLQAVLDVVTPIAFTCAVITSVSGRSSNNVPVWKYTYYGGNYTNTYIPYVGSDYHTSELPILFGTATSVSNMPDSAPEASQEKIMRQAWTSFAKDPENGLQEMNWPKYSRLAPHDIRISYEDETSPSSTLAYGLEAFCATLNTAEKVVSALESAIAPFTSFLSPILSDIENLFNGISIPPVDTSSGSTLSILLSLLQFLLSVVPT